MLLYYEYVKTKKHLLYLIQFISFFLVVYFLDDLETLISGYAQGTMLIILTISSAFVLSMWILPISLSYIYIKFIGGGK